MALVQSNNQQQEFKLVERVVKNPTVNAYWDLTRDYYNRTKNWNSLVQYGCETVETNLEKGVKWIAPKVQSERIKPILVSVDDFGNRQLDHLGNAISSSKERFDNTVCQVKKDLGERIESVDDYLKKSSFNTPLNAALDVTEKMCERFLPEEISSKEGDKSECDDQDEKGPVMRAGKLSKRLQRQTLAQLQQISFRTPESKKAMTYCVDLIQYAAQNLDSGVRSLSAASRQYMIAQQEKLSQSLPKDWSSLRLQVKDSTTDALASIAHAIEVLSSQVSTNGLGEKKEKLGTFLLSIRDSAKQSILLQNCSSKLREISSHLSNYATKGEQVPKVLLSSFTVALQDIRDTVASLYTPWKDEGDPQEITPIPPNDNFVYYFDVLHNYISPKTKE